MDRDGVTKESEGPLPSVGASDGRSPAARRTPPPRRRRRWIVVAALVAAVAIATGAALWLGSSTETTSGSDQAQLSTVAVERKDLVATRTVTGTLGYDDQRVLQGLVPGTITWLPEEGATRTRGQALYRVDNVPVILMYGPVPMYRPLIEGVEEGPDVRQLERNLDALGYEGVDVDDRFDASTAEAVRRWQRDRGMDVTGRVEQGSAIFLPGPRRIGGITPEVGDPATGPLMETSSTTQVVTVDLDAILQTLAHRGDPVTITLPDGSEVRGTITDVDRVARQVPPDDPSAPVVIPLTIEVRGNARISRLDEAPVDVALIDEQAKDVLAVPVTALVALAGGGFGVEVDRGDRTELVPVTPGLFSEGGDVEISSGLSEGELVVVPA
jgi:peptidoglycan hydrolase-like protein with peptidoglycan-binding domain